MFFKVKNNNAILKHTLQENVRDTVEDMNVAKKLIKVWKCN